MTFAEKLKDLKEKEWRKRQVEKIKKLRKFEKARQRLLKEERERERKKQEKERQEREKRLKIEQQLDELEGFVQENIEPYLMAVNKEFLAYQGKFWIRRIKKDEKDLQIDLNLNWEESRDHDSRSGKRLSLKTHTNGSLEVIAGDHLETKVVIDTNEENWQEEFEKTLLSKLSSEEVRYIHPD